MNPPENFEDAHNRHWCDAEYLFSCPRIANADHLYGLSAECGLKAVLIAEGKPIENQYRKHVDKLWPLFATFSTFADGRRGAEYRAMLPEDEPFRNWSVSQRYACRGYFRRACVELHRRAARAVRAILQHAIQGGHP